MRFNRAAAFMMVLLVLCSQAGAVEVTPYFDIAKDYTINPLNAKKVWLGREICIEGVITAILPTKPSNEEGDVIVWLSERNLYERDYFRGEVRYSFYFSGIPDEIMELKEGQRARISGIVGSIEPSRIFLRVTVNEAQLEEYY